MTTRNDHIGARWSSLSMLGLAASVAIIAAGVTMLAMEPSNRHSNLAGNTTLEPEPRYVAVKFQVDGCPMSEAVEAKFTENEERFGKREVLFCRLNITNTTRQQQSRFLAETLGIDCVLGGPCRSGTLMLVDRERDELLAVAKDTSEVATWESALARAVP